MEMDKFVEQLNEVNRKLKQGELGNPARITAEGKFVFSGTLEEMKVVVDLIGEWSALRENEKTKYLKLQKTMLEAELRAALKA